MALPDFLIIGAMKCGTSTLQAQLAAQPGILMSTPKEPNFFSDDSIYAQGMKWYESLFDQAAPGDLLGEASTHYTKLPTYPSTLARLQQALAKPKLIYLIRDPVSRALSHYIHEWTMGNMSSDIETSFEKHSELVDYGRYAYQIEPYLEAFGRDAIFLSTLEEMKRAPQDFLDRVGSFLGFGNLLVWQEEQALVNASAERIRRFPLHGLVFDNPVATALRRNLVPQSVRDRIRRGRQMSKRPELPETRIRTLERIYADDFWKLSAMFPDHPDIRSAYPFLSHDKQS